MPYHTILHYTTQCYTTLHNSMLYHNAPRDSTPHYTTPHYTTLHHITPHHTAPHHNTLHHTTPLWPHHTTPRHTTLHRTTPRHTTPHCTTSHYTTLHHITPHHTAQPSSCDHIKVSMRWLPFSAAFQTLRASEVIRMVAATLNSPLTHGNATLYYWNNYDQWPFYTRLINWYVTTTRQLSFVLNLYFARYYLINVIFADKVEILMIIFSTSMRNNLQILWLPLSITKIIITAIKPNISSFS